MRNFFHIAFLLAAAGTWLLSVYLGFQSPLLGFFGTCGTLAWLGAALQTSRDIRHRKTVRPRTAVFV